MAAIEGEVRCGGIELEGKRTRAQGQQRGGGRGQEGIRGLNVNRKKYNKDKKEEQWAKLSFFTDAIFSPLETISCRIHKHPWVMLQGCFSEH